MTNSIKVSSALSSKFFEAQWQIYQKVMTNNYMNHKEIYEIVQNFMINNFNKPFNLLDLGCGDAHFITKSLEGSLINFYHGVDLSQESLNIAFNNFKNLNCQNELTKQNIIEFIDNNYSVLTGKYDIVFSAFAIHHLSSEEKQNLIAKIFSFLKENGVFILIDVLRFPDETRDKYLQRYFDDIYQNWHLINPDEYDLIIEHMINYDFPETKPNLENILTTSGFIIECLYQDSFNHYFLCSRN